MEGEFAFIDHPWLGPKAQPRMKCDVAGWFAVACLVCLLACCCRWLACPCPWCCLRLLFVCVLACLLAVVVCCCFWFLCCYCLLLLWFKAFTRFGADSPTYTSACCTFCPTYTSAFTVRPTHLHFYPLSDLHIYIQVWSDLHIYHSTT